MKPLDLIRLYADFMEAMRDKVPTELKLAVALEVHNSLPPEALCAACPATREWLGKAVKDVIDNLTPKHERTETAQAAKDEAPSVRLRKARKESVG